MDILKPSNISSNLGLPCVGAVIYEENLKDFADYSTNYPYHQRHHNVTAF